MLSRTAGRLSLPFEGSLPPETLRSRDARRARRGPAAFEARGRGPRREGFLGPLREGVRPLPSPRTTAKPPGDRASLAGTADLLCRKLRFAGDPARFGLDPQASCSRSTARSANEAEGARMPDPPDAVAVGPESADARSDLHERRGSIGRRLRPRRMDRHPGGAFAGV